MSTQKLAPARSDSECPRHPGQTAAALCAVCGKPVCRECIQAFGYFCGDACRDQSRQGVTEEDRAALRAAAAREARTLRIARRAGLAAAALLMLAAAWLVWELWLDPAGKVAWTWAAEAMLEDMQFLSADATQAVVLVGDSVVTLDTVRGRETRRTPLPSTPEPARPASADAEDAEDAAADPFAWLAELAGQQRTVQPVPAGYAVVRHDSLCVVAPDGRVLWRREFPDGHLGDAVFTATGEAVCALVTTRGRTVTPATAEAGAAPQDRAATRVLTCWNTADGREAWARPLEETVHLGTLAAGARHVFAELAWHPGEGKARQIMLCGFAAADGRVAWRARLDAGVADAPRFADGCLVFACGRELYGLAEDGTERFRLSFAKLASLPSFFLRDGLLILHDTGFVAAYDPTTGTKLWALAGTLVDEDRFVADPQRATLLLDVEEKAGGGDLQLPPAYEELEGDEAMGSLLKGAARRTVPCLVAVDRRDGRERWRVRGVYGTLLGSDRRLVAVADTAATSMLEMATGGKGETCVRQFDPASGKELCTRWNELGFARPVLAGRHALGLLYPRTRRPSVLGGLSVAPEEEEAAGQGLGVAAIRLK